MSGNSTKVREKAQSQGKVMEFVYPGNLIMTPWQYDGNKTLMS